MTKILVFTSLFGKPFYGGAERSIFEFYKILGREAFDIQICTLDEKYGEKSDDFDIQNIRLNRYKTFFPHPVIESKSTGKILRLISHFLNLSIGMRPLTVMRKMIRSRPNLVITHNLAGWGYFPWIMSNILGIPVIHDNHDFYLSCVRTSRWKSNKGVCAKTCVECIPRVFSTKFFWRGGVMISNSYFLENEVKHNLSKRTRTRFEVIYPPTKLSFRQTSRLEPKFDVAYVGRLEESKGIREFLEVTRTLNLKIAVGGEGKLRKSLEQQFPEINFLGEVDGLELILRTRILVVPSLLPETFGKVALEGVAAGTPVLISSRGGLSEFKARKGAILVEFNPEDPVDFELKIKLALTFGKNAERPDPEWLENHYEKQLYRFREIVKETLNP